MKNAKFTSLNLDHSKIKGKLSLFRSRVTGELRLRYASIASAVFMNSARFNNVSMRRIKVGQELQLGGSSFSGILDLTSASTNSSVFLRNSTAYRPISLVFAEIEGNLDTGGARLTGINLQGATIGGELRLSSPREGLIWMSLDDEVRQRNPMLNLRNATARTVQDTEAAWPWYLRRELEGFSYQSLGGYTHELTENFVDEEYKSTYSRARSWFAEWLGADDTYSAQPYQQLARVLRTAGQYSKANYILVSSRIRELELYESSDARWWWLWMLRLVIGFGYGSGYFLALAWSTLLVIIGTILLMATSQDRKNGLRWQPQQYVFFSLDMLLPAIRLNREHYDNVVLEGWVKYYFYFHQILGYILVFFVIAGLTRLSE